MIKYLDVYRRMKAEITSGALQAGDFLPTEPELMTDYGVSRTTIRKAVALLTADGYVDARQGRGTEVLAPARREDRYTFTSLLGRTTVESRIVVEPEAPLVAQAATIETVPASEVVAAALNIPASALVHRVQRLKIVGERPAAHIASYLEAERFPALDEQSGKIYYLYAYLAEQYGTRFARSQSRLTAVAADFIESRVLEVPVGSPLVMHARVTESPDGPVEYAESFERPDCFATVVTIDPEDGNLGSLLTYE